MLTYHADPRLVLVGLDDIDADPAPPFVAENRAALERIVRWAREYLSQPHPELGRGGPVCPFVRPAMARRAFHLAVVRGADLPAAEVHELVAGYRRWFLELEPVSGREAQYKSINILFPDIGADRTRELIDDTQERLKPEYVRDGIMIGEFHDGPPDKAGLWNDHFRPLRSPIPLLSIRHMVPTDFAFLRDRQEFMEAYLAAFGEKLPASLDELVRETARRFGLEPGSPPGAEPGMAPELALETARG
jgi:hypothetical protein